MGTSLKEISADKVYGTFDNRAYLMDNGTICNIDLYKERSLEDFSKMYERWTEEAMDMLQKIYYRLTICLI